MIEFGHEKAIEKSWNLFNQSLYKPWVRVQQNHQYIDVGCVKEEEGCVGILGYHNK